MRRYLVLCVLAACGDGADGRLAARRAALGLAADPLAFADAMDRIREKGYEPLLARVGSKRLRPDEVLDAALDLENLLARADPSTAESRPADPKGFDSRLADARRRVTGLARAVAAGGNGATEAREVVASCTECHLIFRKPR